METFEYSVKTYSMKELERHGVVVHPENNIVFACRPDGACDVHDVASEQTGKLSLLFNEMGREGWELIQLFFHLSGVVSFWKRRVGEEG